MRQSGKVALGGIFGALSLMFMLMTVFPLGTYALPAIAGALLIPVVIEAADRAFPSGIFLLLRAGGPPCGSFFFC